MALDFRHINQDLINQIRIWHDDAETKKRIDIDNLNHYYSYVMSRLDYFIWIISDEEELVGELCVEIIGHNRAAISYTINPGKRNKGYCKRILKEMMDLKELSYTDYFEAWVDSDNYPSIKCLESVGYIRQNEEPDENQFFHYVFKRRRVE